MTTLNRKICIADIVQKWFEEQEGEIIVSKWPLQFPDHNSIENFWDDVETDTRYKIHSYRMLYYCKVLLIKHGLKFPKRTVKISQSASQEQTMFY